MMNNLYNTCNFKGLILLLLSFFLTMPASQAQVFFTEDFEDHGNTAFGGLGRYNSPADFYETGSDFWGRVQGMTREFWLVNISTGQTIANTTADYSAWNGNFYYAGEDTDDTGATIGSPDGNTVKEITFSGININGGTNLMFKGLFAAGENDPCGSSSYDNSGINVDYIKVFYNIDAGGEIEALCFHADIECNIALDVNNEPLHHDPNCDGDGGEGAVLTAAFAEFGFPIAGTGTSMDLIIRVSMNGDTEEAAVDYIRLESDTPIISACTADNGVFSIN